MPCKKIKLQKNGGEIDKKRDTICYKLIIRLDCFQSTVLPCLAQIRSQLPVCFDFLTSLMDCQPRDFISGIGSFPAEDEWINFPNFWVQHMDLNTYEFLDQNLCKNSWKKNQVCGGKRSCRLPCHQTKLVVCYFFSPTRIAANLDDTWFWSGIDR